MVGPDFFRADTISASATKHKRLRDDQARGEQRTSFSGLKIPGISRMLSWTAADGFPEKTLFEFSFNHSPKVNQMAGIKFLNPILRIVLCGAMMAVLGYYLYPVLKSGDVTERMTIIRGLVFLGFAYLLVQSLRELFSRR